MRRKAFETVELNNGTIFWREKKKIELKKDKAIRQMLNMRILYVWNHLSSEENSNRIENMVKKVNWKRNHAQNQEDFISNNLIYNLNASG